MNIKHLKFSISHNKFCVVYISLVYVICNAINFSKLSKWFIVKEHFDYLGLTAFLVVGWCASVAIFTLISTRKTIKPLAIFFVILSAAGTYFITKYSVAIDRGMIMNAIHTDHDEVKSLLSIHMLPYFFFLVLLPIILILRTHITFKRHYFLSSLKMILMLVLLGVALVYAQFASISRAANLSKKYIIHSLIPLNFMQSIGSIAQHSVSPYFSKTAKKVEISGQVTAKENLIVVLAVGETSRQQNFSLYGYKRQNTTPILSQEKGLHALNGVARVGSTLYALPEIFTRDGAALPAITSKLGVDTACYVNYTLYDNCSTPGEIEVSNCKYGKMCYDEDVLPLLEKNLKSYQSGQRFVVLHLGGGSHGPSYYQRYPEEFQKFKPMCFDADVVNHCSVDELYNAYDNSILYTDHVLGKIINQLDKSKLPYVFIYLSDHGESLLEDGRIFHGMPPGIDLPYEQSHIPLLVKSSIPIKIEKRAQYSQQDVFDTVLELLSIKSNVNQNSSGFIKRRNEKN